MDLGRLFDTVGASIPLAFEADLSAVRHGNCQPFPHPVQVRGTAANRADVVTLDYSVQYRLDAQCDRCLAPVDRDCTQHFEHTVVEKLYDEENTELLLCKDGLIDMDELITSDILLELPIKILCREDCKGLCPKCGANLNETNCGCDTRQADPRLDALRKLLEE